jgi:hypothetical protein
MTVRESQEQGNACTTDADPEIQRIRSMPREVGVLLVVAGIGGLLLPGPVGTPFLLVGGVVLWPRAFSRAEEYFERKFPKMHRQGVKHITRFVHDLERRYPFPK